MSFLFVFHRSVWHKINTWSNLTSQQCDVFVWSHLPLWLTGIWECKDGTKQQLQSLWQVHSGELSGERHRERVRARSKNIAFYSWKPSFCESLIWGCWFFRAYVEKYLLEKSRLVYQEHNERWEPHRRPLRGFWLKGLLSFLSRLHQHHLYQLCNTSAETEIWGDLQVV